MEEMSRRAERIFVMKKTVLSLILQVLYRTMRVLEKRDAIRKDELYNKLISSKWSYEQVIKLISSDPPEND